MRARAFAWPSSPVTESLNPLSDGMMARILPERSGHPADLMIERV